MRELTLFDLDLPASAKDKIELFKDRKISGGGCFILEEISKITAYSFVRKHHYLGNAKFFSIYNFGLRCEGDLVGVATFSLPQGTGAADGWFGLKADDPTVLELTRLAMLPELNGTNATSYLLANSIKELKKKGVRAVITLADASRHVGSIYQVCNFKYFGMADDKSDFYEYPSGKKNVRGETKNRRGVWVPRTRKYRYAYIMDKHLKCRYAEQERPQKGQTIDRVCCGGTGIVKDSRFGDTYTCPVCTGKLERIG